jgi:hypothetical protein
MHSINFQSRSANGGDHFEVVSVCAQRTFQLRDLDASFDPVALSNLKETVVETMIWLQRIRLLGMIGRCATAGEAQIP